MERLLKHRVSTLAEEKLRSAFSVSFAAKMLKSSQSTTVAESGGGKNSHTGRPQTVTSTTLAKSIVPSDEFKTGFPSEGLSTFSNKWWGSGFPDGYVGVAAAGGESAERCENEEKDVGPTPKGTGLLMDMRKRAVEEGRESLKLGVVRGFSGATKAWNERQGFASQNI